MEIIDLFLSETNKTYTQQYLGSILNRDERAIWRRLTLLKQKSIINHLFLKFSINNECCEYIFLIYF